MVLAIGPRCGDHAGMGVRTALRRLGADGLFADPNAPHGSPVEGWYWRIALPDAGRVIAVMGGIGIHGGSAWGNVVLALHPEHEDRERVVLADVRAASGGIVIGDALSATAGTLRAAVDDVRVDCAFGDLWPLRPGLWGALGPGHLVPGLGQHWTPISTALIARGEAVIGGTRIDLTGGRVYHERNWGGAFPRRGWWWGAAHAFDDPFAAVAFAGGALGPSPAPAPTAIVVRTRRGLVRLGPPQLVRVEVGDRTWSADARGVTARVRLEARADDAGLLLSHPAGGSPGSVERLARQHLDGHVEATVERRGRGRWRVDWTGACGLAGLERGTPA